MGPTTGSSSNETRAARRGFLIRKLSSFFMDAQIPAKDLETGQWRIVTINFMGDGPVEAKILRSRKDSEDGDGK